MSKQIHHGKTQIFTKGSDGEVTLKAGVGQTLNVEIGTLTTTSGVITATTDSSSTATGCLQLAGGCGIAKNLTTLTAKVESTTDSSSTTTGGLIVSGGLGCAKRITTLNSTIGTADITTANITTDNVTTANITTANITTANLTTISGLPTFLVAATASSGGLTANTIYSLTESTSPNNAWATPSNTTGFTWAASTGVLTILSSGIYTIDYALVVAGLEGYLMQSWIEKNTTDKLRLSMDVKIITGAGVNNETTSGTATVALVANDTLTLKYWCNGDSNILYYVNAGVSNYASRWSVVKISG